MFQEITKNKFFGEEGVSRKSNLIKIPKNTVVELFLGVSMQNIVILENNKTRRFLVTFTERAKNGYRCYCTCTCIGGIWK